MRHAGLSLLLSCKYRPPLLHIPGTWRRQAREFAFSPTRGEITPAPPPRQIAHVPLGIVCTWHRRSRTSRRHRGRAPISPLVGEKAISAPWRAGRSPSSRAKCWKSQERGSFFSRPAPNPWTEPPLSFPQPFDPASQSKIPHPHPTHLPHNPAQLLRGNLVRTGYQGGNRCRVGPRYGRAVWVMNPYIRARGQPLLLLRAGLAADGDNAGSQGWVSRARHRTGGREVAYIVR